MAATLVAASAHAADPSPCPNGLAPLGSARAQAAPMLDSSLEPLEALKTWRDELTARYKSCDLAPFEPEKVDLAEKGNAFSHELGRGVGGFRVKPEGTPSAEVVRGLEILDVELPGNHAGLREQLLPLRFWSVWPLKNNGEVVSGCRVELTTGRRAELCLDDIDGVDRNESSAVTTQVRIIAICPPPLAADDVAMVYLSPVAPAPLPTVNVDRVPAQVPMFLPMFTPTETATRELTCNEGRSWCIGLTGQGNFALTQGVDSKLAQPQAADLDGFTIAAPGRWTGVEHTPSGLRVGRSAIGSYHGLPTGGHTRWWLASDQCMVWKRRLVGPRRYPTRVELGSLCLVDGTWADGMQTIAAQRGEPRQVVQTRYLDDMASRCHYTQ